MLVPYYSAEMSYTIDMKLILGLGNPESRYAMTRHNVGFIMCDMLAEQWGASFKSTPKFQADIAETVQNGEKILLAKSTTYYNEVGQSARALMDFYKLTPEDILAIHDDFALPLGTIRTRYGGSGGGNNGIKSLNAHVGDGTARIRVGIYHELRDRINDADFVLGTFTRAELQQITADFETIARLVGEFIDGNFAATTHRAE